MNVFYYFDDLWADDFPNHLTIRWSENFCRNGFLPDCLSQNDADLHPMFYKTEKLVSEFPTVCTPRFEKACWLRWLAYQRYAPALFADYDVINLTATPADIPTSAPCVDLGGHVIYATADAIADFISWFPRAPEFAHKVNGRRHVADWVLFHHWFKHNEKHFIRHPICKEVLRPGYRDAKMLHFSNGWVPKKYRFNKRHLYIDQYLARHAKCV